MNGKQVYTIEDVAMALGVSKTTVSRAISGKGRLSAETRRRVLDFIEAHNFRPNAVARSLAHSRTFNLGLVLPGEEQDIDVAFFHACMLGVSQVASEHDYDVLAVMDGGESTRQIERIIDNHKVDGVIVARSTDHSPVQSILRQRKIPSVIVGCTQDPDMLYVDNRNQEACRDLTALLISRGMRRLALLGGDESYTVNRSRRQGFLEACRQAGLPGEEQLVIMNIDSAKVASAVARSLEQGAECILCTDDYICNLALPQLRELGVRIPEDVKVASFYDNTLLEHVLPSVTSLRFDAVELGRAACRELLNLLEGREAHSRVLPAYQMVLRDSTK